MLEKIKNAKSARELVSYLAVGIANTCVGFGLIFLLMWLGVSPEISNIVGYAVGIVFSYFMNQHFTFRTERRSWGEFARFAAAMGASWLLNFIALKICLLCGMNPYIAQIIAGAVYTGSGFVISKLFVFR